MERLSQELCPPAATLKTVRYFTARVKPHPRSPSAHTDQAAYLAALEIACPKLQIKYGSYTRHKVRAENANPPPNTVEIFKNEEKGSDVNLAVHLLNDVCSGSAKVAILISNDSDLAEAVQLAQGHGASVYWYPPVANPRRFPSTDLARVVSHTRSIHKSRYASCQLPNTVVGLRTINKPTGW